MIENITVPMWWVFGIVRGVVLVLGQQGDLTCHVPDLAMPGLQVAGATWYLEMLEKPQKPCFFFALALAESCTWNKGTVCNIGTTQQMRYNFCSIHGSGNKPSANFTVQFRQAEFTDLTCSSAIWLLLPFGVNRAACAPLIELARNSTAWITSWHADRNRVKRARLVLLALLLLEDLQRRGCLPCTALPSLPVAHLEHLKSKNTDLIWFDMIWWEVPKKSSFDDEILKEISIGKSCNGFFGCGKSWQLSAHISHILQIAMNISYITMMCEILMSVALSLLGFLPSTRLSCRCWSIKLVPDGLVSAGLTEFTGWSSPANFRRDARFQPFQPRAQRLRSIRLLFPSQRHDTCD